VCVCVCVCEREREIFEKPEATIQRGGRGRAGGGGAKNKQTTYLTHLVITKLCAGPTV